MPCGQDLEVAGEQDVLTASIDISREEVENYNNQHGGNDFYCQCYARYTVPEMSDPQYLASSKGYVQVACTCDAPADLSYDRFLCNSLTHNEA